MMRRAIGFVEERYGSSLIKKTLRYVFPDHWSFMLGEVALYAFVVLVGTGIFLTFFFSPSHELTTYTGSYLPLQGQEVTQAYDSAVDLSLDVPAGLLFRQTHHWAANVFIAAIVMHLLRIFFTGAFRKPREINYMIGVAMLGLALPEGFFGYSLPDDLLSGMGLAIAYSVGMATPVVGGDATFAFFGGEYPGSEALWPRMYALHVLVLPVLIAALIGVHLATIMRQKHTQFPGLGKTERNVVGSPLWPGYALRSLGLMFAVAAVLFLLGGLVQINPIWEWGPYHAYEGTNGAQPDWYLGWLIGSLRLMPPLEPTIGDYTLAGNAFWGGLLFPTVVFMFLLGWPWIERRITGDRRRHELLDRPRDNPTRTAVGAAFFTWVSIVFFAGTNDRVYFGLQIPYEGQVWFWRFGAVLLPLFVFFLVRRVCRELQSSGGAHPARGFYGTQLRRTAAGGFEVVETERGGAAEDLVAASRAADRPPP
jgi:ubiquinol-cytochrome c reductase cytochrome b subunit